MNLTKRAAQELNRPLANSGVVAGCDVFTLAQLLGHCDVRVTMRYVRSVEETWPVGFLKT